MPTGICCACAFSQYTCSPTIFEEDDPEDVDPDLVAAMATGDSSEQKTPAKKDYVVDVWPFAEPEATYESMLVNIGATIVCMQRTAHPALVLAGWRLGCNVIVYTKDLPSHSQAHAAVLLKNELIRTVARKHASMLNLKSFEWSEFSRSLFGLGAGSGLQVL